MAAASANYTSCAHVCVVLFGDFRRVLLQITNKINVSIIHPDSGSRRDASWSRCMTNCFFADKIDRPPKRRIRWPAFSLDPGVLDRFESMKFGSRCSLSSRHPAPCQFARRFSGEEKLGRPNRRRFSLGLHTKQDEFTGSEERLAI